MKTKGFNELKLVEMEYTCKCKCRY